MTDEKRPQDDGTIVTPVFRLAFPLVFEKTTNTNNNPEFKPQYEITMLFPKPDNKASLDAMRATGMQKDLVEAASNIKELLRIASAAAKKKFGDKLNDPAFRKSLSNPVRDADAEEKATEGFQGHWFIRPWNRKRQPPVISASKVPVTDASLVYGGMYCRAWISAFGWTYGQMKRGVSFSLLGLQVVKDGEPFASAVNSAKMDSAFDAIEPVEGGKDDPAAYAGGAAANVVDPFAIV